MRKKLKRYMSILMTIALSVTMMGSVKNYVIAASGVSYSATLDKKVIEKSTETQKVTVTVDANKEIIWDGIGFRVFYDAPLKLIDISNKEVTLNSADIQIEKESGINGAGFRTENCENSTITNICVLTFEIPADTPTGKYELGIRELEITSDYGEIWEADATAITILTIEGEAHIHTLNKVEAKEASCKQAGNNEYWLCSICGQAFKDKDAKNSTTVQNETIEKLAHTWSEWKNENNIKTRTCTVCGEKETESESENANGPSRFRDVIEGSYYCDAVNWAVGAGVTSGTSAENFSPDMACSRAQAVTFLYRAAGSPDPAGDKQPFLDVDEGTYYYNAVLWAVENGITTGTSETTFSPDAVCSRAQIVTFLWRAQGSPKADTANPFSDVKTDAYYGVPVLWAVENGITSGTSATTFSPDTNCSRAQIVTFLYRNYVK